MNRITRRIFANKDYSQYKNKVNNAYSVFKSDVSSLSSKFDTLLELLDTSDIKKINKQLADMISDLDSMSANLIIIKNHINNDENE